MVGLLLSVAILFVMDKLDDRVSSFVEFRSHFPEHVLGEIPQEDVTGESALLQREDLRHGLLESFSTLRSSLVFLPTDGKRPRTIMITSAAPSEGKTTIAANFAVTLAFAGAKVLLIDADLRRGRIHGLFGVARGRGLSEVLCQRATWREAVVPTNVENLHLIPRGKALSHPAEYLLGKLTDNLLRETSEEYDYVILDSAPVMVADDALSLAPKTDGVIFVIRFAQSSVRQSRHAIEVLKHRQVNLIGVVCNDVKASEGEYGYGAYDHYSDDHDHDYHHDNHDHNHNHNYSADHNKTSYDYCYASEDDRSSYDAIPRDNAYYHSDDDDDDDDNNYHNNSYTVRTW
jgi:capsular exopolysaccharide synthesis family protein